METKLEPKVSPAAAAAALALIGELERVWEVAKQIGVGIDLIVGAIEDGGDPERVIALAQACSAREKAGASLPGGLDRFLRTACRLDRAAARRRERRTAEDAPIDPASFRI